MNGAQGAFGAEVLAGRRVCYTVRESRTARKCRIRVRAAGVEVVVPRGAEESRAGAFLRENATWVLEQLAFFERAGTVRIEPPAPSPGTILLRGREVPVEIVEEPSARSFAIIEAQENALRVRVPQSGGVDRQKALEAWLRRQARKDIEARLAQRATELSQRPGRVFIKGQRTKWGSCSRRRNLSFNWRLVMAPPAVLDYIVVHELAHLAEPSHSTRFWLIVRSFCPDCETHRGWLRDHQERLGLGTAAGEGQASAEG